MILDSSQTKEKILSEFLQLCAFEGWNDETLLKTLEKCGIATNLLPLIFENGALSLAEFYVEFQNQNSAEIFAKNYGAATKIRDKIRFALYARFEVEKENKIALQRLVNFYLNPNNFTSFEVGPRPALQSLQSSFKVADFIWKNIGDSSSDFNFYTKRLTLAKIILRALKVFLEDESKDLQKTKNFIDAQIASVMQFEQRKAQFKKFSTTAKNFLCESFLDENQALKSPKEIIKNLPFFRLKKF